MDIEHEQTAAEFITALKTLAERPENLNNFQLYLSIHFPEWLKRFANTPEDITAELKHFAELDI
jgi:hypothetical protein